MKSLFNNVVLLPWQSAVLTWSLGAMIVLLLGLLVMSIFRLNKKEEKEKWHAFFFWICLMFIISSVLSAAIAASILVDLELGWKFSLLAGFFVVGFMVSMSVMFVGALKKMSMKLFFLWMFLFLISGAVVITLFIIKLGKQ